jgi:hypothetical protein
MLLNEPINLVVISVEGLPAAGTGAEPLKYNLAYLKSHCHRNKPPTLSDIKGVFSPPLLKQIVAE